MSTPKPNKAEMRPLDKVSFNPLNCFPVNPESDDFQNLLESIRNDGQHTPAIIKSDGMLLSGHRRLYALKEIGAKEILVIVDDRDFPTELDERRYINTANNTSRDRMTPEERIVFYRSTFPNFDARLKIQSKGVHKDNQEDSGVLTNDYVAAHTGLSFRTVQRDLAKLRKALKGKTNPKRKPSNISDSEGTGATPEDETRKLSRAETKQLRAKAELAAAKRLTTLLKKVFAMGQVDQDAFHKVLKMANKDWEFLEQNNDYLIDWAKGFPQKEER